MEAELVAGPVQFAQDNLGLTLPVVSRMALRQLESGGVRVGLRHSRFKPAEARKVEIAAALWHLLARPNQDVVVCVGNGNAKVDWIADLNTVLQRAGATTQREVAVYNGTVITRFLGPGKLRFNVAAGKYVEPVGEIASERPLLIVAGIDSLPTNQALPLYQRFAPPASILATSYEH